MRTVSLVTACLNTRETIVSCLESAAGQTVPFEHIVVDGSSTDGTRELLGSCGCRIARLISEPDQGIYDALNKGIGLATGDILGILHADDLFAHERVLEKAVAALEEHGADSCYGDLEFVDRGNPAKRTRFWRAGGFHPKRFYQGWMPPHPTFFARREVYERHGGFRLDLGTSADYELMLRFLFREGISTVYLPEVLVRMRTGGRSNASFQGRLRAHRMDRKAWEVNGLRPRPWTLVMKPLSKVSQFLSPGGLF